MSKHVRVLERAGLIWRRRDWRVHLIDVPMVRLREIEAWFAGLHSAWARRLAALDPAKTQETGDA